MEKVGVFESQEALHAYIKEEWDSTFEGFKEYNPHATVEDWYDALEVVVTEVKKM